MRAFWRSYLWKQLGIVLSLVLFLTLTYSGMRAIILTSFEKLEQEDILDDVERSRNQVEAELQQLLVTAGDYAGWDEAYAFTQKPNSAFVKTNLDPTIFNKLRLNLFVYLSNDGKILYANHVDYRTGRAYPLPAALQVHLRPGSRLLSRTTRENRVSGLLQLSDGIMMIAAHPVLTSAYKGPAKGCLVIGRWLDVTEVRRLAELLRVNMAIQLVVPEMERTTALPNGERVGLGIADDTVTASVVLRDLYDEQAGALHVSKRRDIYGQGRRAVNTYFLITALIAAGFSGALLFFTSRLKQSQEFLQRREEELREAQHLARLGNWEWDSGTDAITWSDELYQILDRDPELPLPSKHDLLRLFTPECAVQLRAAVEQCLCDRQPYKLDLELRAPVEGVSWVLACGQPKFDRRGNIIGLRGMIQDISERKRYEDDLCRAQAELEQRVEERTEDLKAMVQALCKSEERYQIAVEGASDGIWDWDIETAEVYFSPRWKLMLGYDEAELDSSYQTWHDLIHPDDLERTLAALESYLDGRSPQFEQEYRLRRKDGSYNWILTRGACCRDRNGKAYRIAGSHTDISRRKLAEQALTEETARTIRALEALREKEQMLLHQSRQAAMGEMIGNVAHQWRQPLNTLGLLVQQIPLFYDLGEVDREFLANSTSRSMDIIQHMSKTIDDFRNYFQPDKERVQFRVSEVVERTLALMEGAFGNHRIDVDTKVEEDPLLEGYPNEFAQVLLNIVNNAKDALTERRIETPLITIVVSSNDARPVVTIADNAGGIADDIIGKIFEPYFTTKGPQYGTGVGLFMSKTIIEKNMGGRLTASNTTDGAAFRIEL